MLALYHDGIIGSAIYRWNGNVSSLAHYDFDADPRAIPFAVAKTPPRNEAIIGAAGGHEVLASLWFGAKHIDAVELNPVTYSLVKTTFANFDGHLAQDPAVNYVNADGRSFMARSQTVLQPDLVPGPGQLRGHQCRHGQRLRALRELPLHHQCHRRTASST